MERDKYLKLCQRASYKEAYAGAWWAVKWDETELVRYKGDLYVPFDYRFGFQAGNVTGVGYLQEADAQREMPTLFDLFSERA